MSSEEEVAAGIAMDIVLKDPEGTRALARFRSQNDAKNVLSVIQNVRNQNNRAATFANKAFWEELANIMQMDNHEVRSYCCQFLFAYLPSSSGVRATEDYTHALTCLPHVVHHLDLCTNDGSAGPSWILSGIMNRCTLPPFALAYAPAFPTLVEIWKRSALLDKKGPDDFYGKMVTIVNNLVTCEEAAPLLRELGVVELAAVLLSNPVPVMRVFGEFFSHYFSKSRH
jgi:hypothetical protein